LHGHRSSHFVTALILATLAACSSAGVPRADAGSADAATVNGGAVDAGSADAATVDVGTVDAGSADAGTVNGGTVDAAAQNDVGAAVDWTQIIPGNYRGTEVSATQGTVRANYTIEWSARDARYLVRLTGSSGSPKLYLVGVDVDPEAPTTGYLTFPEQVYSPGATGPVMLLAQGTGRFRATGLGRSFDGTYDTATRTLRLMGRITVQPGGQSESFSFTFTP
jgi:hypothetical protein